MEQATFNVSFQARQDAVRDAIERLITGLQPWGLDSDMAGTVELVIAEALNNVVEHAYANTSPPCPVHIACERQPNGVLIRIMDEGSEMPNGALPMGLAPDVDVDLMDLPEGGFGWFLIRDLAKDVEYHRDGAHNILNLRLDLATT